VAITWDSIVKLQKAKQIVILIIILALVGFLYWYMADLPAVEKLAVRDKKIAEQEIQLNQLRTVEADTKRFKEEVVKKQKELNLAMTKLPTSKEIPNLLASISNLGKESGLEFLLFRPGAEVNKEFYAEIPVEIRVRGTYSNVAVFFDKVGKIPRIVNITNVAMDGAKERLGRWEITTACTATTFKYIEPKEQPEPAKGPKPEEKKGAAPAKR
jgi:type IV pilus assembly protein PilO